MSKNETIKNKIDTFKNLFGDVERAMQIQQGLNTHLKFEDLVKGHNWDKSSDSLDFLKRCADLRNFYSHKQSEHLNEMAIPAPKVVSRLKQELKKIISGPTIENQMVEDVIVFSTTSSLYDVLATIDVNDFSQFPIYDDNLRFKGLLTEKGITNWIANERDNSNSTNWKEVNIQPIIKFSSGKGRFVFMKPKNPVRSAILMFSKMLELEAVLITDNGKNNGKLLGIFTIWDVKKSLEKGY